MSQKDIKNKKVNASDLANHTLDNFTNVKIIEKERNQKFNWLQHDTTPFK